jgi:hypothetical protein
VRKYRQVAVCAILFALVGTASGCGGSRATVGATSTDKPTPPPTRYAQVIPAGISTQRAAQPLCATYKRVTGSWQQTAERRRAILATVPVGAESYAAYLAAWHVAHKAGRGWLKASSTRTFSVSIATAASNRLEALAGPKNHRFLTAKMEARFMSDTLYLCHQSHVYAQTRQSLSKLDKKAKTVLSGARAKVAADIANARAARIRAANAWHQGYLGPLETENGAVYVKWTHPACADYAIDGCWHIQLTAARGCSSLFVEMNELQGGTIVGNAIASQNNVPPRTPVLLELDADTSATVTASAPKITCYP